MTGQPRDGSAAAQTDTPQSRPSPLDRRLAGPVEVLAEARRTRLALGLEGEPDKELIALSLAAVGFVAGEAEERLEFAWRRWRATVSSPGAARADLTALRVTLQSRLGGPCTKTNSLVDALIALEDESGGTGWQPLSGPDAGTIRRRRSLSRPRTSRIATRPRWHPRAHHPAPGGVLRRLPGRPAIAHARGAVMVVALATVVLAASWPLRSSPAPHIALLPNYTLPQPAAPSGPAYLAGGNPSSPVSVGQPEDAVIMTAAHEASGGGAPPPAAAGPGPQSPPAQPGAGSARSGIPALGPPQAPPSAAKGKPKDKVSGHHHRREPGQVRRHQPLGARTRASSPPPPAP